jgi:uncharacterized protein (TIGR02996 family)
MSDEAALLAAILAQPDEDTPRLVYADWLDEHADALTGRAPAEVRARATFIRIQIELARGGIDAKRRKAAETRCAELEAAHGDSWLAALRAACGDGPQPAVVFRRGFVGDVFVPIQDVRWATAAIDAHPAERLSFETPRDTSPEPAAAATHAALALRPGLARVRRIDFQHLPISVALVLLPSPHLTGLRSLRANWMPADAMEALVRSPAATGLRELWARGGASDAPPGSLLRMFLAADWPALEEVRLDGFADTDDEVRAVVAAGAARGWRRLHVLADRLTPAGVRAAVVAALPGAPGGLALNPYSWWREQPPELPRDVRELWLSSVHNQGDALAGWVRETVPPSRFDRLTITRCGMNAAGAVVLSGWEGLAHLTELDLSNNWIGDHGASYLAQSPHLDRIETLFVAHNDITKRGKDALKKRFGRRVRIA